MAYPSNAEEYKVHPSSSLSIVHHVHIKCCLRNSHHYHILNISHDHNPDAVTRHGKGCVETPKSRKQGSSAMQCPSRSVGGSGNMPTPVPHNLGTCETRDLRSGSVGKKDIPSVWRQVSCSCLRLGSNSREVEDSILLFTSLRGNWQGLQGIWRWLMFQGES